MNIFSDDFDNDDAPQLNSNTESDFALAEKESSLIMHQQDAKSDDTMVAADAAAAAVNDLAAQGNLLKGIVIWLVAMAIRVV